jgi:hypothetical protein
MLLILVMILVVLLIGGFPTWGYHDFGYYPSGAITVILVVVIVLFLLGRL